jgi:hypothetical protein
MFARLYISLRPFELNERLTDNEKSDEIFEWFFEHTDFSGIPFHMEAFFTCGY